MTNPNIYGQSFPSGSTAPWIQKLHTAHRPTVILGGIAFFSGICALDFAYNFATGHKNAPASHNPAWAEATRSYLRAQNCNPITGVSSKK
ncbi:hypothetical protein TrST_g2492 [Triparma strigata]|uniref:Uncharacterized protein n=2 Tax=Triparma TaxID=722752 RepID=A0A9W7E6K2_9STRA|nr:hypothetical protein TrST_g2492 [Triparma strigata]|mmetsp:Transcript_9426/g.17146  ORF Transcript_9426/g.17146 Transcript_9426/m.17146 type:complete len:90 (+) Transcript_9426:66-335(+)|eukprot:CAMPEP_0182499404 /NCGR_PEP_ID=MMETSP1321-20130603/7628_1 /TAXON_ID=91990 /ORGANISM="Bolidomonas sp., Strain RCC1657" /LENGTH=89 /DNA_ID=CAMNT_0024703597 /DNA_START=40 /DNA_END=309 /DNA_ORIENTATION=-